jgi:ATP-dependent Clp protease protease subunit
MSLDVSWLRQRLILLNQNITDESAKQVIAGLLFCNRQQPGEEITMVIRSRGGTVYAALAIHDTMHSIESPVSTVGSGLVGGIATLLLAAGEQGRRYVKPTCTVLLPYLEQRPAVSQIQEAEITRLISRVHGCLFRYTRLTQADLEELKETPFTAEDAIQWGIADHVKESELD